MQQWQWIFYWSWLHLDNVISTAEGLTALSLQATADCLPHCSNIITMIFDILQLHFVCNWPEHFRVSKMFFGHNMELWKWQKFSVHYLHCLLSVQDKARLGQLDLNGSKNILHYRVSHLNCICTAGFSIKNAIQLALSKKNSFCSEFQKINFYFSPEKVWLFTK